ncbi:MAG: RHS repeat-associated core domain-containing protein [Verrucomicrobiota bacterium]
MIINSGIGNKPRFIPDPGVYDRLEVDNISLSVAPNGEVRPYLFGGVFAYNPDTYRLITKDGRVFTYNDGGSSGDGKLQSVKDRNDNLLTFTENGIFHSSGLSIQFVRDSAGRITRIDYPDYSDPDAATPGTASIQYDYDSRGDLVRQTDAAGRYVDFNYFPIVGDPIFGDAPDHFLYQILDPDGNPVAVNTYDPANGRLDTITDGEGNTTLIFYDEVQNTEARQIAVTDADGATQNLTTLTRYDDRGNILEYTNENNVVSVNVYGDPNNPDLPTEVYEPGYPTLPIARTFDNKGNMLTQTDRLGNVMSMTYDSFSNLTSEIDQLGRVIKYSYNDNGRLVQLTDPKTNSLKLSRDALGRVKDITDGENRVTQFIYPSVVDPFQTIKPAKVIRDDSSTLDLFYNSYTQVTRTVNESGDIQDFFPDEAGLLTKSRVKTSTGDIDTDYYYNFEGELVRVVNALGQETLFEYDRNSRLISRKYAPDPSQPDIYAETTFDYDELGRLISITDPLNRVTKRFYRNDGVISKIVQPDNTEINFEYDAAKNRTAVIDPNGNRTEFVYDGKNRIEQRIEVVGTENRTTLYEYDSVDNLTEIVDRLGRVRKFVYDSNNQLIKEIWIASDGLTIVKEIDLTYDNAGNLDLASDEVASFEFQFDSRNRVDFMTTTYTGQAPFTLDYSYNDVLRQQTITDGSGVNMQSIMDERGILTDIFWHGGGIAPASIKIDHNALGDIEYITRYNAITQDIANVVSSTDYEFNRALEDNGVAPQFYNASGRQELLDRLGATEAIGILQIEPALDQLIEPRTNPLRRITKVEHQDAAALPLQSFDYNYDDAGQLDDATENSKFIEYTYDLTGQLTDAVRPSFPTETENFAYDDAGNRTSANSQNYTLQLDEHNQYDQVSNYTLSHDLEGNLIARTDNTSGEVQRYTYDHRNRLAQVINESSGGSILQTVIYEYDLFDRRIRKRVDASETVWHYQGNQIWKEDNGSIITHYIHNNDGVDDVLARHRSGSGLGFYLKDRIGTVQSITNSSGNIVSTTDYSSYGEIINQTGVAEADQFGFTGREWDSEVGLYYYRARYYDPKMGRFISQDPIRFMSSEFNLKRYAENSPCSYIDPLGLASTVEKSFTLNLNTLKASPGAAKIQFSNANMFLKILQTPKGPVTVYTEVSSKGSTLILRNFSIEAFGKYPGTAAARQVMVDLGWAAKQAGYNTIRLEAERVAGALTGKNLIYLITLL